MRQTLTNNFWELHKNVNCAFPLTRDFEIRTNLEVCLWGPEVGTGKQDTETF